jgi:AcrR family transcriptional regulator
MIEVMSKVRHQAESARDTAPRAPYTSSRAGGRGARPVAPATARGEATRRRILDAAERVFGELGYYEASVSQITRRARVAQGTFYIYFRTKQEIFEEVVADLGKRLRQATREAIASAPNRLEVERRGFLAFFAFVAHHRQIYRIIQEAERVAPEAAYAYYRRISEGYERALREAMEAGEVYSMDPEAIAYALMGIGHFLALRWLIWPQDGGAPAQAAQLPDRVTAAVLEFITRGLSASAGRGGDDVNLVERKYTPGK